MGLKELRTMPGEAKAAVPAELRVDASYRNTNDWKRLEHVFSLLHTGERNTVPPFLCFESYKTDAGTFMRFLGLACPGGQSISALDDLVAVWRVKGDARFQNYRATLTILREETNSRG